MLVDRIAHEADISAASSAEVKNAWIVPPLNHNFSWHVKGEFLGEFAKLRKTTTSSVKPFRSSVRMEHLGSHGTAFHEIFYLFDDFILCRENLSVIKI